MAEAAERDARRPRGRDVQRSDRPAPRQRRAREITTADAARAELVEHLTAGVDWVAAVERMAAAGVTTFIEVGPGRVLTGLIKRIAPDAEAIALDQGDASAEQNSDAFYDLGKALLLGGRAQDASAALNKAIALKPADPSRTTNLRERWISWETKMEPSGSANCFQN